MKNNDNNLIKISEYYNSKGMPDPQDFFPDLSIISRHINNLVATYGDELVEFAMKIRNEDTVAEVKRALENTGR